MYMLYLMDMQALKPLLFVSKIYKKYLNVRKSNVFDFPLFFKILQKKFRKICEPSHAMPAPLETLFTQFRKAPESTQLTWFCAPTFPKLRLLGHLITVTDNFVCRVSVNSQFLITVTGNFDCQVSVNSPFLITVTDNFACRVSVNRPLKCVSLKTCCKMMQNSVSKLFC